MSAINLSRIERQVLSVIRETPEAANDEAMLLDRYYHKYDNYDDSKSFYWNMSRSTRPETITKRRRDLHRWGYITYSKEADERRTEAFNNEREYAKHHVSGKAVSWND